MLNVDVGPEAVGGYFEREDGEGGGDGCPHPLSLPFAPYYVCREVFGIVVPYFSDQNRLRSVFLS